MKTVILIAILAMTVGTAGAQYNQQSEWDRQQEYRRQQEELDAIRRRQAEIEQQQRRIEQQRIEQQRWQNNPLIPESQRRRCAPGQTFC